MVADTARGGRLPEPSEERNFTLAAARVGIDQPALSQ
jgi:hypothetical protein